MQSGSGYRLQGYAMSRDPLDDSKFVRDSDLSDINIPLGKKLEPHDTTEVKYQCNLDSRSEAYLPYGYSDIPFNTQCGWDGNRAGTIRVDLAGYECDISVKSLTDVRNAVTGTATADAGTNGTNYLSITVDDGLGTPQNIIFNMTGIEDGLPVLETAQTTISIGPSATPTDLTVDYEDGVLKLKNGSETVYQSNLYSAMNYKSFTLTNKSVTPNESFPMLLEFDESVLTECDPSDLARTYADATIWWEDSSSGTVAMNQIK